MANFALVENDTITEKHDLLPKAWKQVSGLNLLENDESILNSLGWYKVIKVTVSYDIATQYIIDYSYNFIDGKVYETPILADVVATPSKTQEELFNEAMITLRIERDVRLANSDWTQLADVQAIHDNDWKTSWANYRQELRDLPNLCTTGQINIYEVNWPIEP